MYLTYQNIFCFAFPFFWQRSGEIQYWEAECVKIDAANKKIRCRSVIDNSLNEEFLVDYDYLVIAMGAQVNTFNTPGVNEHCHFLKVDITASFKMELLQH